MQNDFEHIVKDLRKNWNRLSGTKRTGTVAIVDLTESTRSKVEFPAPDIGFERIYRFLEITKSTAEDALGKVFIKFLGDGVMIFGEESEVNPSKFIEFGERLAVQIEKLNQSRYSTGLTMRFKCALDFGPDIYLLVGGDPMGTVIDRAFRIQAYLQPNMVGASREFLDHINKEYRKRFALAGKAYLKGISEDWQEIYALKGVGGFSLQLSMEQKVREALRDFWQMGEPDRPIWIVSGAIPKLGPDRSIYSLHHGDANALVEIVHTLSKAYPDRQLEVVNSEEYLKRNKGSFDNDIVCVSGPSFNSVTSEAMKLLKLPLEYEFDEQEEMNKEKDPVLTYSGKGSAAKFETEREDAEIVSDVAVLMKIRDAFARGRFFYLLMGNQTQGTYAATQLFGITSHCLLGNWERLKDGVLGIRTDRFGLIARTKVFHDFAEPIDLGRREEILLCFKV